MGAIAKKIQGVMKACKRLTKDGYNSDVGYPYVTAAKLIDTVNEALTRAGIVTAAESRLLDIREVKGVGTLATVEVTVKLLDVDSDETLTFKGIGSGYDGTDKSVAKAQTMALKYAFKSGLLIAEASDDPDADSKTKPRYNEPTKVNKYEEIEIPF